MHQLLPFRGITRQLPVNGDMGQRSAHDVMRLITEEIGELARQSPGQRQRLFRTSKTGAASSG